MSLSNENPIYPDRRGIGARRATLSKEKTFFPEFIPSIAERLNGSARSEANKALLCSASSRKTMIPAHCRPCFIQPVLTQTASKFLATSCGNCASCISKREPSISSSPVADNRRGHICPMSMPGYKPCVLTRSCQILSSFGLLLTPRGISHVVA